MGITQECPQAYQGLFQLYRLGVEITTVSAIALSLAHGRVTAF